MASWGWKRKLKLDDFEIKDFVVRQAFDQIRELLNFGKYQKPIITTLPSWAARPGETVLFRPSSGGTTQYCYLDSAWVSTWSITV